MVEVSNNFKTECEAYVGSYKFGKIKVNYIDDNPLNYEQGAYSSTDGTKIDATQSVRYNELVECEPNFKYTIELGNSAIKMKIITYTEAQAFIAAHDNLVDGSELTTEATAKYISVTIYSNDTLEGTAITLNNTIKNGEIAGAELQGNTSQDGTPTPTNPIEVNNVTGEQTITISNGTDSKDYEINLGANILDIQNSWVNSKNSTQNGLHYILNEDDTISISGTSTGYSGAYARNYNSTDVFMTLRANHTYRLLVKISDKTSSLVSRVYFGKTSDNLNSNFAITSMTTNGIYYKDYKPTEDINLTQYSIIGASSAGETSLTIKIAIYDITTNVINDYIPYFDPIELNKIGNYQDFIRKGSGKNLFNQESFVAGDITVAPSSQEIRITSMQNLYLEKGSYTFSWNGISPFRFAIQGQIIHEPPVSPYPTLIYNSGWQNASVKNFTFTLNQSMWVGIALSKENNAELTLDEISKFKYQIEKGTTATYYEPYGYKDKWYIEKNVGKIILSTAVYDSSYNRAYINLVTTTDGNVLLPSSNNEAAKLMAKYFVCYSGNTFLSNTSLEGMTLTQSGTFSIRILTLTSKSDYETWLQSNNTTIYYALANPTYTLIDNEELIEQLDAVSHAETFNEITNIMSIGDLPAILDVMPDLTESIRGKQIKPYIGYNITSHDDLKNFKITGKADSNGKILGATPQTQIDIEIFNENNKHNLENKQIYVSTGLEETEGNYVEWQPFTITQAKDTQTKNHTTYTGYDDMMRNTTPYIDNIDYGEEGIPLYDYLCKVAKQIGMAVANDSIVNGDFIVRGNNFTNNEKISTVLSDIGKIADGFMMINRDNLLEVVDIAPIDDTREAIELTTNLYNEDFQNSPAFGPTNELAIGETNIETNAIVKSDEEAIAKDGVKKIEILDNYFLGELADKEEVANVLWEHLNGFSYYPHKTPYNGYPYIDLGDKLNITDINNNTYNSFIFNYVFEYNGGYKGNAGAEALSVTAAKYKTNNTLGKQFRKVGIEINRVEGKISSEIEEATDNITKSYNSAIEQSAQNIQTSVTSIEKTVYGDPADENDKGLEGSIEEIKSSMLTINDEQIQATISQASRAEAKADAVDDNTKEIVECFNFTIDGLTITNKGGENADSALQLGNSQIAFLYRGQPILTLDGSSIVFSSATFEKLDLGNYVWQAEDDDSLSLIYEGGNT